MVGAVFYFEDLNANISSGVPQATIERWVFNTRFLGANKLIMIDITTYKIGQYYQHTDSNIEFERYETLEEVEERYPKVGFIYLENESSLQKANIKSTPLFTLKHPKEACYVAGPDSNLVNLTSKREDKTWVTIPVDNLWAETAINICLYDRLTKI